MQLGWRARGREKGSAALWNVFHESLTALSARCLYRMTFLLTSPACPFLPWATSRCDSPSRTSKSRASLRLQSACLSSISR